MLTIYSKKSCTHCVSAKMLLEQKGIPFTEIKVDEIPEAREFLMNEGHRSVPQIYKDTKLFVEGGFQGLVKLSDEELRSKLNFKEE